jgi:hypothetical protein
VDSSTEMVRYFVCSAVFEIVLRIFIYAQPQMPFSCHFLFCAADVLVMDRRIITKTYAKTWLLPGKACMCVCVGVRVRVCSVQCSC